MEHSRDSLEDLSRRLAYGRSAGVTHLGLSSLQEHSTSPLIEGETRCTSLHVPVLPKRTRLKLSKWQRPCPSLSGHGNLLERPSVVSLATLGY